MRYLAYAWLTLVMLFILAPAGFVVFDSFNSATSFPSPFEGATLHWYAALAGHPEFLSAAWTSLVLAVSAAAIATVAGFLAAWGLSSGRIPARNAITTTLMGPLLVPELVVGLAILQIVGMLRLSLGLPVLVAAHAVFVLPVTTRLSLSGFSQFNFSLEEAARDLGARSYQTLLHVTLPLLRPSLVAGFVLAAVLSFVNLPLSMFLTTAQTSTLPVIAFAYMESRIDPMIAAVATLVMLTAAGITLAVDRLLRIRLME
jgi:putative spermidine/putrescine transport system permease protein